MNKIFTRVFIALLFGVYLIFAMGGAAIASAAVQGQMALAQSFILPMVAAAMSWLAILGIPCLVWGSYILYKEFLGALSNIAEEWSALMEKRKNSASADRTYKHLESEHSAIGHDQTQESANLQHGGPHVS